MDAAAPSTSARLIPQLSATVVLFVVVVALLSHAAPTDWLRHSRPALKTVDPADLKIPDFVVHHELPKEEVMEEVSSCGGAFTACALADALLSALSPARRFLRRWRRTTAA
jgi:hypothetical protein